MPIRWIGGILPLTVEREAGSGYPYVRRESNLKYVGFESKPTLPAERNTRIRESEERAQESSLERLILACGITWLSLLRENPSKSAFYPENNVG
jgi:hypothetical protein